MNRIPRSLGSTTAALLLAGMAHLQAQTPPPPKVLADAVQEAQTPRIPAQKRPEQKLSDHDQSPEFKAQVSPGASTALKTQPDNGEIRGFDFYRDPLNAKKPMQTPEEITAEDKAMKPKVMEAQRQLLEKRYILTPKLDAEAKMSRGKPLPVGPTARLANGATWEQLAGMTPEEVKKRGVFPYPSLVHPLHANGGQVFPQVQTAMF